jgi:arginyl-tRNA synthetase
MSSQLNLLNLKQTLLAQFPDLEWSLPPDVTKGILTTNQAFKLAKELSQPPVEIALDLASKLNQFFLAQDLAWAAQTAGPYVNILLKAESLQIKSLVETIYTFGKKEEDLVVDMFHPNVGKKMHVGHMRSANLGESMRRMAGLFYRSVTSDNHLGDWGIQFTYTSWGLQNFDKLDLDISSIDWHKDSNPEIIAKCYKIYVRVNALLESDPSINLEAKAQSKLLERGLQQLPLNKQESDQYKSLYEVYTNILKASRTEFLAGEKYFNLNKNPVWLSIPTSLDKDKVQLIKDMSGAHQLNPSHKNGEFDLVLGESFYIQFLPHFQKLVAAGLAVQEGEAIYIDLEEQKLGRCYLMSSEGYSLYHSRDIINRIVYAGYFGFTQAITFADTRQSHSFDQVFAVLEIILKSEVWKGHEFGFMSSHQVEQAYQILTKKMAMFEGFGFFSLPDGVMSTRKGLIFEFEKFQKSLETTAKQILEEKNYTTFDTTNITKISVAALKWADLYRDREQDVVFDAKQVLKFEGNTGVYQLYSIARLNSILEKEQHVGTDELDLEFMDEVEKNMVYKILQLPLVLELSMTYWKPHYLCTYQYELAASVNSWYSDHSIKKESDGKIKRNRIVLTSLLKSVLSRNLELLGIEPVHQL